MHTHSWYLLELFVKFILNINNEHAQEDCRPGVIFAFCSNEESYLEKLGYPVLYFKAEIQNPSD